MFFIHVYVLYIYIGSVRRKKQPTGNKAKKNEDKRILAVIKRFQPQPLADVLELNMFRDDNTVLHFKRPQGVNIYIYIYIIMGWDIWEI